MPSELSEPPTFPSCKTTVFEFVLDAAQSPENLIPVDNLIPAWLDSKRAAKQLHQYLTQQIHPAVGTSGDDNYPDQAKSVFGHRLWDEIVVKGDYQRKSPSWPSWTEDKTHRLYNWQRATAEVLEDGRKLQINCFPGDDYVRHYTYLIKLFFAPPILKAFSDQSIPIPLHRPKIQHIPPPPQSCRDAIWNSNLQEMDKCDIVVIGYLDHAPTSCTSAKVRDGWEKAKSEKDCMFHWTHYSTARGRKVAFLGSAFNIWGDISSHLVEALKERQEVKCVIYVGKVGCLKLGFERELKPNEHLATGNYSSLYSGNGSVYAEVEWKNPLTEALKSSSKVTAGKHVTVPSPLCENRAWHSKWRNDCHWVDCETGHMALTAQRLAIDFGYIHLISDSLTGLFPDSIANEDDEVALPSIEQKRADLYTEIDKVLEAFFESYE